MYEQNEQSKWEAQNKIGIDSKACEARKYCQVYLNK